MDNSIEQSLPKEEDTPAVDLLPCHVCGRTFVSASLKKHEKVCEKSLVKKRKPFDSLKQRVEGTDIAPFHQKTYLKKPEPVLETVKKPKRSSWKEKHLELLNSIRAARGTTPESDHSTTPAMRSTSSFLADTERCPSCDRQFGPKAYDRHVEWCKEKKANQRIQHSPANVLLAKERLEARIKYVPPLNRTRKTPVREKYSNQSPSPGKTGSTTSLVSQPSIRRKAKVDSNLGKSREKVVIEPKREIARGSTLRMKIEGRDEQDDCSARSSYDLMNCSLPAIASSPKTDSLKSSPFNKQRNFPLMKINKPNINSQVDGITVASMKYDGLSKKLVTWRDTITSQSENILKCDRIVVETIRETQSVSAVNVENDKKMSSSIEDNKKKSVKEKNASSKNVALIKKMCWNQAKNNNNNDQNNEMVSVKVSSLQAGFEKTNKQKCCTEITEEIDRFSNTTSSFSLDLKLTDSKDSQKHKFKRLKEQKIKNPGKTPTKNISNKKIDKTNNNKTNDRVDTKIDDENNKQKNVTQLQPNLDENQTSLDYNWNKDLDNTGVIVEKQFVDVDVQGDFSFEKFVRRKYCTKPSTPNSDSGSSIQTTNTFSLSSTIIKDDMSPSISSITNTPLNCSKTKLNLDISQGSLISTTVEESSNNEDSFAASDLRSLPKFDWSKGELPTFTKSITCFKDINNFPSESNTKIRVNNNINKKVSKSSSDSKLNYIDDVGNKNESINKKSSTLKEEEQNESTTLNDSIVLLFKSTSENQNTLNEESHDQILFKNCDSESIELENSKSSNYFLKKSLSDIDINNSSNSKNNLISIFSRHFKDCDDNDSLNSKKDAVRSLPNIILHYNDECLANKNGTGEKSKYALENKSSSVIDNERNEKTNTEQKPTTSKEMLRRKILEIGAKEFLQDFRLNEDNFGFSGTAEDYSVPKKKRKLDCISSSKSQSEHKDFHSKLSKRKKRYKKSNKKEIGGDICTHYDEAGDKKVPMTVLPQLLLPFRSRINQRPQKSTRRDYQIKCPNIDSDDIETIRKKSSQVDVFNENKSVVTQLKLPPINSPKRPPKDEKAIQVNFFERLPRCLDRNYVGSKYFLKSSASRSGRRSVDDPFHIAQQQLLELLECEDFKDLKPQQKQQQQQTTSIPAKTTSSSKIHHVPTESLDLEQHIMALKDSLESLTDDFELMESLIDENYRDTNNSSSIDRKIIEDETPDIDPYLINENDNLSLPENFDIDDESPVSSITNHFAITKVDNVSKQQQQQKHEQQVQKTNIDRRVFSGNSIFKKSSSSVKTGGVKKSSLTAPSSAKTFNSSTLANKKNLSRDFSGDRKIVKSKLTNKSVCSYSTEKIVKLERKDSFLSSKKSVKNTNLSTSIKNSRNTRGANTVEIEEQSKGDWFNINNELNSEISLKPEDLFAVDDAMYEEFKKYEELYLKGRKQKQSTKKQKPKLIEINYKILASSDEKQSSHLNSKISTDSAYGSLTRNTPEHRNIIPNHLMLEETILDGAEVDEADKCTSPSDNLDHRMSKFCHECGNKYPVASAKFCVECGVRRLIL